MRDAVVRGPGWRLRVSHEGLTVYRHRRLRWRCTMSVPADRLVDLQVDELEPSPAPRRHARARSSGSVVICTVVGAHRTVCALRGLTAYEMRLALAPVLAEVEGRGAT
jgi:hypothetical protein